MRGQAMKKRKGGERMTFGSFALSALAVLVLLGIGQRVLDKMRLTTARRCC